MRLAVTLLAAAFFVVFVLTSGAVFWPRFDAIDHFDEATYVSIGRVLVDHGRLRGVVGQTFDLADTAKAHQVMTGRDFFGKLVLHVP